MPISVGEPISRLYASIMLQRLVKYRLTSTVHPGFAPEHVIDKHRHANSILTTCYADLKSAYDKLQWHLLWASCNAWGCMAACWVLSSPYMMAVCCLCGLGSEAPVRVLPPASDRAAHRVPHSLASSLIVCTTGCRPPLQLLECKPGISSWQTWYMLLTSTCSH